jgi:hypothetical protein
MRKADRLVRESISLPRAKPNFAGTTPFVISLNLVAFWPDSMVRNGRCCEHKYRQASWRQGELRTSTGAEIFMFSGKTRGAD